MEPEILTWKGLHYSIKPFTLDTLYSLWEGIGDASESGKVIRGVFENTCKAILKGENAEAQSFLNTSELTKSILNSEDVEAAMAFKGRIDFFSNSYTKRGQDLMKSAPDLTDKLVRKEAKSLPRKSPKDTKGE